MRKLTLILSLVFTVTLFVPSFAFGLTRDDLVERDGLHYKKFTDVPFTGKVTGRIQASFKNGKHHGPFVSYHKNGQLQFKGTFKDDKMHGPWVSYTKDGTVEKIITGTWKDGVKVKYKAFR